MHELPRPALPLVIVTQALLGALFMVGIGAIVGLPSFASTIATVVPEYAELQVPLVAVTIAIVVLALIVLGVIAMLVQRIYRGSILERRSLLWVDLIVAVLVCGAVLVIVAFTLISGAQAGSPFVALILAIAFLTIATMTSISLVLRTLLRRAITINAELDEVV